MTALLAASLSLLMIFTALLSGVFGMAGGLILVGVGRRSSCRCRRPWCCMP